ERWNSKEAVPEKSEELQMAGRRWADAKTGGPATGIDVPVGLDVGVIEVERGFGRRKRRVGSAARRCDRRKGELGGGRVAQATVGALSGVRGARVIACSGLVGQRANSGPGCVDADVGRQWWAEARTGRSGRGQRRVQSCASEPVVDPEVRRMLEQQARKRKGDGVVVEHAQRDLRPRSRGRRLPIRTRDVGA